MVAILDVQRVLREGHTEDIALFDQEFERETTAFAAHLERSYAHLLDVLTLPEEEKPPQKLTIVAYLLDAANSLMAAYGTLRYGYPVQAMDLARRIVELTSVAAYVSDKPSAARGPRLYKLKPSKCVQYAKRHMPRIGQAYGLFSTFDHAHSAMLPIQPVFDSAPSTKQLAFPLGPFSVGERRPLFKLVSFRLLASAHNLEGVIEMLLFWSLKRPKRYWVAVEKHIEYRPIAEELECEASTAGELDRVGRAIQLELERFKATFVQEKPK